MFEKVLLATLLLLALGNAQGGVMTLNDTDFPQVLQDHPHLFIKLYTPWCGHCKKLVPIFIELAASLKASHPEIQLAEMDLDSNKDFAAKYQVSSYPTLIYFKGGVPTKFGGSRSLEFMTFWLNKKFSQPIIPIEEEKLTDLETDGNVNIVFYGDIDSPKAFILASLANADDFNMYYQVSPGSKQVNSVEIFRPFAASVQNNVVDHSIKNWISLFDRPFVYPFGDRTSGEIFTDKRNAVFLFEPAGATGQSVRQLMLQVAADWKIKYKRRLIFTEIYRQSQNFSGLSDYFKVDPDKHFLVFVKSAEKQKFLYKGAAGELTRQGVQQFIKGVEGRKIKAIKLDAETRPAGTPKTTDEL